MDPINIITATVSCNEVEFDKAYLPFQAKVSSGCVSTAQDLNNLRNKWLLTSLSFGSLCPEIALISASLSQIQCVLEAKLQDKSSSSVLVHSEIVRWFDIALAGCAVVLSCINHEMEKIEAVEIGKELDWKSKIKVIWKEDTMKELEINYEVNILPWACSYKP
jgi:hypothetical protein